METAKEVEKKYKLDVLGTLQSLGPGDTVTFVVAGPGREVSYQTLYSAKAEKGLKLEIRLVDESTRAVVTGI